MLYPKSVAMVLCMFLILFQVVYWLEYFLLSYVHLQNVLNTIIFPSLTDEQAVKMIHYVHKNIIKHHGIASLI
jgi:hypothetical protein